VFAPALRPLTRRIGLSLMWIAAGAALASCDRGPTPGANPSAQSAQIEQVYGACVQEMLRSTCRVANDKTAAAPASSVFVAGVGQIDAASYQSLRAAGDAMCSLMRDGCTKDWSGSACRTARSLWAK
jgi:hypothetical protein